MTPDRSRTQGHPREGTSEAESSRHLGSRTEPVTPHPASAVGHSLGTRPVARATRPRGRHPGPVGVMVMFTVLAVGALGVLGAIAVVGLLPTDPRSAAIAPPATAAPTETPEAVVLEDGTVVDPSVADVIDDVVGEVVVPLTSREEGTLGPTTIEPELVAEFPDGLEPAGLEPDPRGGAIFVDTLTGTVHRARLKNGKTTDIVRAGDKVKGSDGSIGKPVDLAAAGPDVVIVDDDGRPWRWRPTDGKGAGSLSPLRLQGRDGFDAEHGDMEAYTTEFGDYRIYVVEPGIDQVMRYQQSLDRQSFTQPSEYLATTTSEVDAFDQLYVDFDVYALDDNALRRFRYGKWDGGFQLEQAPGATILGSNHDYRFVEGSGRETSDGRLYLYDAANDSIVGFSKVNGSYLGEWATDASELDDVRGMFVIEGGLTKRKRNRKNDTLVWVTPQGIYRSVLRVASVDAPR